MRTLTILLLTSLRALASDELFDAARKGDVAAVKAVLDTGVPVDSTWRYGQTALFIAAGRGHTDVVKLLLGRGAKADVRDSFYGMTAVGAAADKGNVEIVTMLLDKGAPGAESFLMMAAGKGDTAMVRAIAVRPGLDPKVLTQALSSAEAGKHTESAAALKDAGARTAVLPEAAALEKFRGKYAAPAEANAPALSIEPKGNLLSATAGTMQLDLRPLDEVTFEPVKFPGMQKISFVLENGRVTGAELSQGGRTVLYKRLEEQK